MKGIMKVVMALVLSLDLLKVSLLLSSAFAACTVRQSGFDIRYPRLQRDNKGSQTRLALGADPIVM